MYNSQIIWYDKEAILGIFPITERTYFRKLRNLGKDVQTKTIKNKKGKNSTLIHYQDLKKLFLLKRTPSNLDDKDILRKYVGTASWDYFGNIKPERTSQIENINKMKFLYSELKKFDKKIIWFFHLEENPRDNYYHCHYLINTKLDKTIIKEKLELICGNDKEIDLQKYDYDRYHFRGSFYSNKYGKYDTKYNNPYVYWELLR
jgi:hypothetical protein